MAKGKGAPATNANIMANVSEIFHR